MRVLVVGTMPGAVERAAAELAGAGHDVLRCHEPGDPPFPCAALVEDRTCPLEAGPLDLVVTARDRPWPRPSLYEGGAVCALRQLVPLVAVDARINPFARWTVRDVGRDEDLAAACEEAATAPLPRHGEVATAAARGVLEDSGVDPSGAGAVVRRVRGALEVAVSLPDGATGFEGSVAARVITALRELDAHATGIDVGITKGGGA